MALPAAHLWLIALPTTTQSYLGFRPTLGLPRITSIGGALHGELHVRGFRIQQTVSLTGGDRVEFEGCWLEAGLDLSGTHGAGHVWNCVILGPMGLNLGSATMDVAMNTLVGGGIAGNPPGYAPVHDNLVLGPTATGIDCASDLNAFRNLVRGCAVGIRVSNEASAAYDNVVEDCTGTGIDAQRASGDLPITGNTIRRCGQGIELTGSPTAGPYGAVSGNTIEATVGEGILIRGAGLGGTLSDNIVRRPGGRGIDMGASYSVVTGNRVEDGGSDGMVLTAPAGGLTLAGNVVGHSAGRGIVTRGPATVRNNTSYLNGGAGFDLAGTPIDSLDHNIAFSNDGFGLRWSGAAPVLGCNDWFGNSAGGLFGVAPAASDQSVDPLFCDAAGYDIGLQNGSPLAAAPGCGLVGALGVGCAIAGAQGPAAPAIGTLELAAAPNPAAGGVRFAWASPVAGAQIALFDVTGRRRWSRALDARRGEFVWAGLGDDGRPVAAGVYFARLTSAGRSFTRRLVLGP